MDTKRTVEKIAKETEGGRAGRPAAGGRLERGLTTGQVAKQLSCSRTNVHRLRKTRRLKGLPDGSGAYRYDPEDVEELGRQLGRTPPKDGSVAAAIYRLFLADGFKATPEGIARIVGQTGQDPDTVIGLWHKFKLGVGSPAADKEARDLKRLEHEYDEQIAAMDEAFAARGARVMVLRPAGGDNDEASPSSRRTP